MTINYQREAIDVAQFKDLLIRSGIKRPVDDLDRLQRMLDGANLIVTARVAKTNQLVGIARSLTDWSYATYLSDLAVDRDFQRMGIGKQLIEYTRKHAGDESMCLLLSAPDAVGFYQRIGMPTTDKAFLYPRAR